MEQRELTREERAAIRALVVKWCANYDRAVGCLPLDCECYMLGKTWTGPLCRYFRAAVLPLDPLLEAALTAPGPVETRGPVPSADGPPSWAGGGATVPPPAPRPRSERKSVLICEKNGVDVWKIRPRKIQCFQGFPDAKQGRAVSFHVLPLFSADTFHISGFERRLSWKKIKAM